RTPATARRRLPARARALPAHQSTGGDPGCGRTRALPRRGPGLGPLSCKLAVRRGLSDHPGPAARRRAADDRRARLRGRGRGPADGQPRPNVMSGAESSGIVSGSGRYRMRDHLTESALQTLLRAEKKEDDEDLEDDDDDDLDEDFDDEDDDWDDDDEEEGDEE